jgi:prephenate dehydrogenase
VRVWLSDPDPAAVEVAVAMGAAVGRRLAGVAELVVVAVPPSATAKVVADA